MDINIKKAVDLYRKKYKLTEITEKSICDTLEKQGYTVVYFNTIVNDDNVTQIISNLKLDDFIVNHKGFTYTNDKYRLVFINEVLSDEERLMVLAHEVGHITVSIILQPPVTSITKKTVFLLRTKIMSED